MAKYQKGQHVLLSDEVEGTKLGGFEVEIWVVDDVKNQYMVMFHDPVVLGGMSTNVFFWVPEDNLKEVLEDGSDETGV